MRLPVYIKILAIFSLLFIASCREFYGVKALALALLSISDATTYNFGSITAGTTAEKTFTVTNSDSAQVINLTAASLSTPFRFKDGSYPGTGGTCTSTLNKSATCTIVVEFAPTSTGTFSDTLTLNFSNLDNKEAQAQRPITGTATAGELLSISDGTTYSFGNVVVNATGTKSFTVTNNSSVTLSNLSASTLTSPYRFKGGTYPGTGGNCGSSLGASSTCTIVVELAPTSSATFTDTLTLNYQNSDGVSFQATRPMTGNGRTAAVLTISDGTTYDYGSVEITKYNNKTFTITNTGETSASTISANISGAPYTLPGGGTCTATLVGTNATCTLIARYSPTGLSTSFGTILLSYNDGLNTSFTTRPLSGYGIGIRGTVDTTFATNGRITLTNLGRSGDTTAKAILAADGTNVYIASNTKLGTNGYPTVSRRNFTTFALDTSFHTTGYVFLTFSTNTAGATAYSLIEDTTGRVLVGGADGSFAFDHSFIARLNTDGSYDNTFNSSGLYLSPGTGGAAISLAVLTDGAILYTSVRTDARGAGHNAYLARLESDATLSWNNSITLAGFSNQFPAQMIVAPAIAHEERVFTALNENANNQGPNAAGLELSIARRFTDGTLDTAFHTVGYYVYTGGTNANSNQSGGIAFDSGTNTLYWAYISDSGTPGNYEPYFSVFDVNGSVTTLHLNGALGNNWPIVDIKLDTSAKQILLGYADALNTSARFSFARLNGTEGLDTTFNTSGFINHVFTGPGNSPVSLIIDTANKYTGVGHIVSSDNTDLGAARLLDTGVADSTFDTDGKFSANLLNQGDAVLRDLLVDTSGRTVASAEVFTGSSYRAVLVRLNTNNQLDTSFHTDGLVYTTLGTDTLSTNPKGIAIGTNGKIYLAHSSWLASFLTDGSLDTSFGTGTFFAATGTSYTGARIQTDGKIAFVGHIVNATAMVTRFLSTGSLDTSFKTDGGYQIFAYSGSVYTIDQQTDGKFVLAGFAGGPQGFAIARFKTSGSLDTTFSTTGLRVTTFISSPVAMKITHSNGLLYAAGEDSSINAAFARYLSNGALDTTFKTIGKVTYTLDSTITYSARIRDAILMTDGSQLSVGGLLSTNGASWAGIRILSNGVIDTGFGSNGRMIPGIGSNGDFIHAVTLQSNGKILIGGSLTTSGITADLVIQRIWP